MKRFLSLVTCFALAGTLLVNAHSTEKELVAPKANATAAQWTVFSNNLVDALTSEHDGLQEAAMRMVIQYGDQVRVDDAVFDVMRIYRDHNDENMRRMAVVALGEMNSKWAINFLKRAERFEKSETIKKTIHAVVDAHTGAA